MKITKIVHQKERKKAERDVLRVAAYCRVSTKYEGQSESFEIQQAVYTEMINSREGWELAGIYADHGISGTRAQKRPQFMQMIEDCEKGLIDCIICKSVSRFARCSRDMLLYIRRLQKLGIRLIFEKEDIDTENSYSEFLLTIRAAFAEEESRSLSENVKWSKRKKAQAGEVPMMKLYGYDNSGENYEIIPEEAEIVRFIFDRYEHGDNANSIAETLKARGVPSAKREAGWTSYSVGILLENEKYIGDCRTQKTFTVDFINKTSKKNDGILPSVYIKNHHPAIISRSQFERCSVIRNLRSINRGHGVPRYPFGEYLRCPHCGHVLFFRNITQGRCYYCEGEGACRRFVIKADPVKKAVLEAYNTLDIGAVQKIAGSDNPEAAAQAQKLLKIKEEYPTLDAVHYWWLDDLVRELSFGRHSHMDSELRLLGEDAVDDRTISIHWRCGLTATLSSGVLIDAQDPGKKAERWDAYVLKHPDIFPRLVEEIKEAGKEAGERRG